VAVRDPHPRAGPAWGAAFGAPLGAAADPQDPLVFLLSVPVAIARPALAKYLWLLVLVSALVLRRLEPVEAEPAEGVDLAG